MKFQTLQLFEATCGRNLLIVKNLEHEKCKGWYHVKEERLFYLFLTCWKLCYVYFDHTCVHASKWRWRVCLFPGWLGRDLEETAGCPMAFLISTAWPPQLRQPDSIMVALVTFSLISSFAPRGELHWKERRHKSFGHITIKKKHSQHNYGSVSALKETFSCYFSYKREAKRSIGAGW